MNVLLVLAAMMLLMMMARECEVANAAFMEEGALREEQQASLREHLLPPGEGKSADRSVDTKRISSLSEHGRRSPVVVDQARISNDIQPTWDERQWLRENVDPETHRLVMDNGLAFLLHDSDGQPTQVYKDAVNDIMQAKRAGLSGGDLDTIAAKSFGFHEGLKREQANLREYLAGDRVKSPQDYWR